MTTPTFTYASESDPGPYPFGPDTPIEGDTSATGDRHALMVNRDTCRLSELYDAHYAPGGSTAGSGATWDLRSNSLRPAGWTSADAAGLPIFPGLLRRDEVTAGVVSHAIRFTAARTDRSYLWPARHQAAAASDPQLPPMGARFRLGANVDISHFRPDTQVVLRAMQHYGLILADNGSNWFFQGTAEDGWDPALLSELKSVPASLFEAVDESPLMVAPDSGAVHQGASVAAPPNAVGGYRLVASDGGVFCFGNAPFQGSTGNLKLAAPIVGGSRTGGGYRLLGSDGGIFTFGAAAFGGSAAGRWLGASAAAFVANEDDHGYWVVASDGRVAEFGTAPPLGPGNGPVIGGARSSGDGLWLAGPDGTVTALGAAPALAPPGHYLGHAPVVGIAATSTGRGYWLVGSDGGVFSYGDARYFGSTGAIALNQPITAMAATNSGNGYWLVASDGGVFSFGDAEPVKAFETSAQDLLCASFSMVGLLIHASVGSFGGLGRRFPKRHGLAA